MSVLEGEMCRDRSWHKRPQNIQPFRDVVCVVPVISVRSICRKVKVVRTMLREGSGTDESLIVPIHLLG